MKYKIELTDESPPAIEIAGGITTRGAGRAQMRAVRDPIDVYGQDEPEERTNADR